MACPEDFVFDQADVLQDGKISKMELSLGKHHSPTFDHQSWVSTFRFPAISREKFRERPRTSRGQCHPPFRLVILWIDFTWLPNRGWVDECKQELGIAWLLFQRTMILGGKLRPCNVAQSFEFCKPKLVCFPPGIKPLRHGTNAKPCSRASPCPSPRWARSQFPRGLVRLELAKVAKCVSTYAFVTTTVVRFGHFVALEGGCKMHCSVEWCWIVVVLSPA